MGWEGQGVVWSVGPLLGLVGRVALGEGWAGGL